MDLSLDTIQTRLAEHRIPDRPRPIAARRAAVAAILRYERDAPDVLLMKRAERPGDRWSGHVSFPGGREEADDRTLAHTAMRETHEEVGLDLRRTARQIGRLAPIRAVARGKVIPMTITPFVYLQTEPAPLSLNHEATDAFWLPLDRVARGELDATYEYRLGPVARQLPCWRYQGHVVWGLTHKMLSDLLAVLR